MRQEFEGSVNVENRFPINSILISRACLGEVKDYKSINAKGTFCKKFPLTHQKLFFVLQRRCKMTGSMGSALLLREVEEFLQKILQNIHRLNLPIIKPS
jgi:hypothetical protein